MIMSNNVIQNKKCLYRKIGNTLYEINVEQSDNAKENILDILARLIATDKIDYRGIKNG